MIAMDPATSSSRAWTANLERLKAQSRPSRAGTLVRAVLRLATAVYSAALAAAVRLPRRRIPERAEILVTGGFPSPNWILNHVRPLTRSTRCSRVIVVTTRRMPDIAGLHAIYPYPWAVRSFGETPARLITFVIAAIRLRPDIIGGFHLLVNGLAAGLLARLVGGRSLYFCGGGPTEVLGGGAFGENKLFSRLPSGDAVIESRLLSATRAFDVMVTMGNRAAGFFEERNGVRPHVIPGGIQSSRFGVTATPIADLILVGRLVPVKQVDVFLKVVQRVRQTHPGVRARVVGDGPLRDDLERQARELGLDDAVVFTGQCDHVERELAGARIFVLTSATEGVSLALLEAMMSGVPAVVPDVGDLRDLVQDGVNGFVIETPTVDRFAERISAMLADPAHHLQLAAAAKRTASAHDVDAVAARWDGILEGLR
jgi:glycosyltransferase involved in cell wall biosynthesis